MGCACSNPLVHDDELGKLRSSAMGQHIVSLNSTTYGLLTPLDQTPPPLLSQTAIAPRSSVDSIFPSLLSQQAASARSEPEVINSWELMSGLDADSFRVSPLPPLSAPNRLGLSSSFRTKENSDPNRVLNVPDKTLISDQRVPPKNTSIDKEFIYRCTPDDEDRVVVYTTSLRGVRKTFEACNKVMAAIQGLGVWACERDVSMHSGFREELRRLMEESGSGGSSDLVPPKVFVKGKYVGGAEEVLRMTEEGRLAVLLEGLPKFKAGAVCDGCGGVRFLPCFRCCGSCKMVMVVNEKFGKRRGGGRRVVVRCPDCNENGLVLCPICS